MRAVVMGYHSIGCLGFQALRRHRFDVAAVVTHRDDPLETVWWGSLKDAAEAAGVTVLYAEDCTRAAMKDLVASCEPDFLFSFYFRNMIPQDVLALARRGALNLHCSLLPRYRGRAPVNWVLVDGESQTGVSLHYMVSEPDAGDIVDQECVPVAFEDTAFTLYSRLEGAAQRLLDRSLPRLKEGTTQARAMDLSKGFYRGARTPGDGRIRWSWPAMRIYNLVRAVTHPYPGAYTSFRGRTLFVWWALPLEEASGAPPGSILAVDRQGVVVAAGEGALRLITVEIAGQPEQPASAFAIGEQPEVGEILGGEQRSR